MIPAYRWLLVVLALAVAGSVSARERMFFNRAAPPCVCPVAPAVATAPVEVEKTYTLSFEAMPWKDVLAWFAKETGLIFLSTEVPTGTLTLKSDKKYTRIELIDLFNEVLAPKNWIIIPRQHSFNIHPADVKIPREILLQVEIEELKFHGNTEVVQVVIKLDAKLLTEDVAPQAKKLLSAFGDVTPFGKNQLIIVDKVKNIKNIYKYLTEDNSQAGHDLFTYSCKSVPANTAAVILAIHLADYVTKVELSVPWPAGVPDQRPVMQRERYATVNITVDESSNRITITGPSNKFVEAQSLLKEIEKGEKTLPIAAPMEVCPPQHRFRLFARFR